MAGAPFSFRPIRPGTFNTNQVLKNVRDLLKDEGNEHKRLMRMTTENWSDPPTFETKITLGNDGIAFTAPAGSDFQVKKWKWLQFGTRRRYAIMSRDWQSHTSPGTLRSGPGQGRVVLRGRKYVSDAYAASHPIYARKWIQIIVKMRRLPFQMKARRVLGNVQATVRGSYGR